MSKSAVIDDNSNLVNQDFSKQYFEFTDQTNYLVINLK